MRRPPPRSRDACGRASACAKTPWRCALALAECCSWATWCLVRAVRGSDSAHTCRDYGESRFLHPSFLCALCADSSAISHMAWRIVLCSYRCNCFSSHRPAYRVTPLASLAQLSFASLSPLSCAVPIANSPLSLLSAPPKVASYTRRRAGTGSLRSAAMASQRCAWATHTRTGRACRRAGLRR